MHDKPSPNPAAPIFKRKKVHQNLRLFGPQLGWRLSSHRVQRGRGLDSLGVVQLRPFGSRPPPGGILCAQRCNAGLVHCVRCSESGSCLRNVYRERLLLPGSEDGSTCMQVHDCMLALGMMELSGTQRKRLLDGVSGAAL